MAAFNGDGVDVAVVGTIGHLVQWNSTDDSTIHTNDKMAAGVGLSGICQIPEIAAVLLCGSVGIAHIVDDYAVDCVQRCAGAGKLILRDKIDHYIVRQLDLRKRDGSGEKGMVAWEAGGSGSVRSIWSVRAREDQIDEDNNQRNSAGPKAERDAPVVPPFVRAVRFGG